MQGITLKNGVNKLNTQKIEISLLFLYSDFSIILMPSLSKDSLSTLDFSLKYVFLEETKLAIKRKKATATNEEKKYEKIINLNVNSSLSSDVISDDDGKTWNKPKKINDNKNHKPKLIAVTFNIFLEKILLLIFFEVKIDTNAENPVINATNKPSPGTIK